MSLTILPICKFAGLYNTETHWWNGYFSPLIVYPNGRVTIAGIEIIYTFDAAKNQMTFDWQVISGTIAKGTITFNSGDNSFSGSINPRPQDGPVSFTGTIQGKPLSCWMGNYVTQAGSLGSALSPLVVHPTGEVTIAGDRIEYQYDAYSNTLTFDWCQIGTDILKGHIVFSINDVNALFTGTITLQSTGKEENYTGTHQGMPLSFWAMYYNTETHWWGSYFSPLIVHNNDTLDIAGQRIDFDYNPQSNNLNFDWQDIKTTRAKGNITFSRSYEISSFSGSINPRPQDGPVEFTGQANQTHTISISNKRSSDVDIYGVDSQGNMVQITQIKPGGSFTYDAYQGQYFLAKDGRTVFSGYYAYPGLTEWNLVELGDGFLPSLESSKTVTFNLINHLSMYLELYKVNADGTLLFYTTIPAKKQFHQITTEKTQWLVMQQGRVIDQYTALCDDLTWIVNATSHPAFGVELLTQGNLTAPPISAYDVGLGDFTVSAMVQTSKPGTVISRKGTEGGPGNGGFLLVIKDNGVIKFATDDGFGFYEVNSVPTDIFDGEHHAVAGVRASGKLSIYVDGKAVSVTPRSNKNTPLNINNSLPMMIGATQQQQEPYNQFCGIVMNVGFWSCALSADQLALVMFGRLSGQEDHLAGFWSLNYDLDDDSQYRNRLEANGNISFAPVFHCVWAYGANNYVFCQIENPQNDLVDPKEVTRRQVVTIKEGTTSLYACIVDNSFNFLVPDDVTLTIEDPSGKKFQKDTNTDTLYVLMKGNSLGILAVVNPEPGDWKITITAYSNRSYHFQLQAAPIADVVETTRNTLEPLFSRPPSHHDLVTSYSMSRNMVMLSWSGWGHFWAAVAVAAVTTVAVVAVVASGGTVLAVGAVVVAGLAVEEMVAKDYMLSVENEKSVAIQQSQGTGGYITGTGSILLIDANVDDDQATQIIYKRRKIRLYPYVTASKYKNLQSSLIGADDVPDKVSKELNESSLSYCTASGHGRPSYLTGWAPKDNPLPEVINEKVTNRQAGSKIFHFFACNCGYITGIGADLVSKGAKAFFGYKLPFKLIIASQIEFCDCDIEIDKALIDGANAGDAYTQAYQLFNQKINRFRADGDYNSAATLEENRDNFVSPTTSNTFGQENATI